MAWTFVRLRPRPLQVRGIWESDLVELAAKCIPPSQRVSTISKGAHDLISFDHGAAAFCWQEQVADEQRS